jgi:hypothetical protein
VPDPLLAMSPPTTLRGNSGSRNSIPHSQRCALRRYFQSTTPKPSHADLRAWFKSQFGYEISQSSISRSLSDNFTSLDNGGPVTSRYRIRDCQWPWIETELTCWLQEIERRSVRVTNLEIASKASQIWEQSDESKGLVPPSFSTGWVVNFKRRHKIRVRSVQNQCNVEVCKEQDIGAPQTPTDHVPLAQELATVIFTRSRSQNAARDFQVVLPLSTDHQIHLIQYNVGNALMVNKSLILVKALFLDTSNSTTRIPQFATRVCGSLIVMGRLKHYDLPESLHPTPLQTTCAHTSWIDPFPFPRFRDNLIKKGVEFVPEDMLRDLFEDLLPTHAPFVADSKNCMTASSIAHLGTRPPVENGHLEMEDYEEPDDYTTGRRCFINWGNPWSVDNWEVTPGFIRKWAWALEGCDDLIRASNRWRAMRHENLIPYL